MRVAGRKTLSVGEWVVAFGSAALAVVIAEFFGISKKWENALVFTVIVFTMVVIVFRPAWGRKAFWSGLIAVFLLHCIVIVAVEQSMPPTSEGPHGLPLIEAGMIEGILILGGLWRRSMKSNSQSS
jgi:hypothetical protein